MWVQVPPKAPSSSLSPKLKKKHNAESSPKGEPSVMCFYICIQILHWKHLISNCQRNVLLFHCIADIQLLFDEAYKRVIRPDGMILMQSSGSLMAFIIFNDNLQPRSPYHSDITNGPYMITYNATISQFYRLYTARAQQSSVVLDNLLYYLG